MLRRFLCHFNLTYSLKVFISAVNRFCNTFAKIKLKLNGIFLRMKAGIIETNSAYISYYVFNI